MKIAINKRTLQSTAPRFNNNSSSSSSSSEEDWLGTKPRAQQPWQNNLTSFPVEKGGFTAHTPVSERLDLALLYEETQKRKAERKARLLSEQQSSNTSFTSSRPTRGGIYAKGVSSSSSSSSSDSDRDNGFKEDPIGAKSATTIKRTQPNQFNKNVISQGIRKLNHQQQQSTINTSHSKAAEKVLESLSPMRRLSIKKKKRILEQRARDQQLSKFLKDLSQNAGKNGDPSVDEAVHFLQVMLDQVNGTNLTSPASNLPTDTTSTSQKSEGSVENMNVHVEEKGEVKKEWDTYLQKGQAIGKEYYSRLNAILIQHQQRDLEVQASVGQRNPKNGNYGFSVKFKNQLLAPVTSAILFHMSVGQFGVTHDRLVKQVNRSFHDTLLLNMSLSKKGARLQEELQRRSYQDYVMQTTESINYFLETTSNVRKAFNPLYRKFEDAALEYGQLTSLTLTLELTLDVPFFYPEDIRSDAAYIKAVHSNRVSEAYFNFLKAQEAVTHFLEEAVWKYSGLDKTIERDLPRVQNALELHRFLNEMYETNPWLLHLASTANGDGEEGNDFIWSFKDGDNENVLVYNTYGYDFDPERADESGRGIVSQFISDLKSRELGNKYVLLSESTKSTLDIPGVRDELSLHLRCLNAEVQLIHLCLSTFEGYMGFMLDCNDNLIRNTHSTQLEAEEGSIPNEKEGKELINGRFSNFFFPSTSAKKTSSLTLNPKIQDDLEKGEDEKSNFQWLRDRASELGRNIKNMGKALTIAPHKLTREEELQDYKYDAQGDVIVEVPADSPEELRRQEIQAAIKKTLKEAGYTTHKPSDSPTGIEGVDELEGTITMDALAKSIINGSADIPEPYCETLEGRFRYKLYQALKVLNNTNARYAFALTEKWKILHMKQGDGMMKEFDPSHNINLNVNTSPSADKQQEGETPIQALLNAALKFGKDMHTQFAKENENKRRETEELLTKQCQEAELKLTQLTSEGKIESLEVNTLLAQLESWKSGLIILQDFQPKLMKMLHKVSFFQDFSLDSNMDLSEFMSTLLPKSVKVESIRAKGPRNKTTTPPTNGDQEDITPSLIAGRNGGSSSSSLEEESGEEEEEEEEEGVAEQRSKSSPVISSPNLMTPEVLQKMAQLKALKTSAIAPVPQPTTEIQDKVLEEEEAEEGDIVMGIPVTSLKRQREEDEEDDEEQPLGIHFTISTPANSPTTATVATGEPPTKKSKLTTPSPVPPPRPSTVTSDQNTENTQNIQRSEDEVHVQQPMPVVITDDLVVDDIVPSVVPAIVPDTQNSQPPVTNPTNLQRAISGMRVSGVTSGRPFFRAVTPNKGQATEQKGEEEAPLGSVIVQTPPIPTPATTTTTTVTPIRVGDASLTERNEEGEDEAPIVVQHSIPPTQLAWYKNISSKLVIETTGWFIFELLAVISLEVSRSAVINPKSSSEASPQSETNRSAESSCRMGETFDESTCNRVNDLAAALAREVPEMSIDPKFLQLEENKLYTLQAMQAKQDQTRNADLANDPTKVDSEKYLKTDYTGEIGHIQGLPVAEEQPASWSFSSLFSSKKIPQNPSTFKNQNEIVRSLKSFVAENTQALLKDIKGEGTELSSRTTSDILAELGKSDDGIYRKDYISDLQKANNILQNMDSSTVYPAKEMEQLFSLTQEQSTYGGPIDLQGRISSLKARVDISRRIYEDSRANVIVPIVRSAIYKTGERLGIDLKEKGGNNEAVTQLVNDSIDNGGISISKIMNGEPNYVYTEKVKLAEQIPTFVDNVKLSHLVASVASSVTQNEKADTDPVSGIETLPRDGISKEELQGFLRNLKASDFADKSAPSLKGTIIAGLRPTIRLAIIYGIAACILGGPLALVPVVPSVGYMFLGSAVTSIGHYVKQIGHNVVKKENYMNDVQALHGIEEKDRVVNNPNFVEKHAQKISKALIYLPMIASTAYGVCKALSAATANLFNLAFGSVVGLAAGLVSAKMIYGLAYITGISKNDTLTTVLTTGVFLVVSAWVGVAFTASLNTTANFTPSPPGSIDVRTFMEKTYAFSEIFWNEMGTIFSHPVDTFNKFIGLARGTLGDIKAGEAVSKILQKKTFEVQLTDTLFLLASKGFQPDFSIRVMGYFCSLYNILGPGILQDFIKYKRHKNRSWKEAGIKSIENIKKDLDIALETIFNIIGFRSAILQETNKCYDVEGYRNETNRKDYYYNYEMEEHNYQETLKEFQATLEKLRSENFAPTPSVIAGPDEPPVISRPEIIRIITSFVQVHEKLSALRRLHAKNLMNYYRVVDYYSNKDGIIKIFKDFDDKTVLTTLGADADNNLYLLKMRASKIIKLTQSDVKEVSEVDPAVRYGKGRNISILLADIRAAILQIVDRQKAFNYFMMHDILLTHLEKSSAHENLARRIYNAWDYHNIENAFQNSNGANNILHLVSSMRGKKIRACARWLGILSNLSLNMMSQSPEVSEDTFSDYTSPGDHTSKDDVFSDNALIVSGGAFTLAGLIMITGGGFPPVKDHTKYRSIRSKARISQEERDKALAESQQG